MAGKTSSKGTSTAAIKRRKTFDASASSHQRINAKYDIAQTTDENKSLWTRVDSLSAAAANNPAVRKTIRERARYEVANNGYAKGISQTLTNDAVGPSIQLQLGESDKAQQIEKDFEAWAKEIGLWRKIRTSRMSKVVDGEVFGMLTNNRKLKNRVKLDVRPIECDMVESYFTGRGGMLKDNEIDGIRFDSDGNPSHYRVLKNHPGDYRSFSGKSGGDWIRAKYILHYYRHDRPGQVRGVSELTPALNLFGQMRKYTSAVIEAASRAAEISAVMQTDLVPDSLAADLADPVTILEAERNAIVSLPEGWKLNQLKAEQPSTGYKDFKAEIINEMARCLDMPFNIAAGNSSGYNYASGRLDHQTYDRSIEVEREDLQSMWLDPIYFAWLDEYADRNRMSPREKQEAMAHEWYFAGRPHVDPVKEAKADDSRLKNGTLTMSSYYSKRGKDWKRESEQWMRERIESEKKWADMRKQAGLEPAPYPMGEDEGAEAAGDMQDKLEEIDEKIDEREQ